MTLISHYRLMTIYFTSEIIDGIISWWLAGVCMIHMLNIYIPGRHKSLDIWGKILHSTSKNSPDLSESSEFHSQWMASHEFAECSVINLAWQFPRHRSQRSYRFFLVIIQVVHNLIQGITTFDYILLNFSTQSIWPRDYLRFPFYTSNVKVWKLIYRDGARHEIPICQGNRRVFTWWHSRITGNCHFL
jgi:hypothetical protein